MKSINNKDFVDIFLDYLQRKSDNEIRQIIRQTSNENTRRLAEEEADRRGISY